MQWICGLLWLLIRILYTYIGGFPSPLFKIHFVIRAQQILQHIMIMRTFRVG